MVPSRSTAVCRCSLTVTGVPAASFWWKVFPSAWVTISEGMVMVASVPPMPPSPGALLAMTTPMAPATWAVFTFEAKVQVPRSMRAILPLTAAPFVSAEHPSAGTEATRDCGGTSNACGPNEAGAASWLPAMSAGVEIARAETVRGGEIDVCVGVVADRLRRAGGEPGIVRRDGTVLQRDRVRRDERRLEPVRDSRRMRSAAAPLRTGERLVQPGG